jgi:hypothetical protein
MTAFAFGVDGSNQSGRRVRAADRRAKVCETLRAALPSFDVLTTAIAKNGAWWNSFRQKTHAISQTESIEPLAVFAARAYTSSSPAELGLLAVAYARCLNAGHHLYGLVDNLVISNFAYAATIEGMECLVLLAKTYTDIAQPRKAWFMWRKGLAFAQLMVRTAT